MVVDWIHGVAEFAGVELLAWCVMDSHFHMLVYVPEVPEKYRISPSESPDAYAFGMRPAECNPPLWSPAGNVPPDATMRRPPTGFTLPDDEMVRRLEALYGEKRAEAFARRWEKLRVKGKDSTVEAEKEPFLRRMYCLSPFVKTIKERIARHVNSALGRCGHVFEGRFFSGLVEEGRGTCMASLYVDYNPVRAGMVADAAEYRWCSFAAAHGGRYNFIKLDNGLCKFSDDQALVTVKSGYALLAPNQGDPPDRSEKPVLVKHWKVSGNPDIAQFHKGKVVIPCGHQGVLLQK